MKYSPKPFAVEIKRSRRAPALALEPLAKERGDAAGPAHAPVDTQRSVAAQASDADFTIPAFLQTDKPAARSAPDLWSKEAAQVFGPKPGAESSHAPIEERARPRILQSLVPVANPLEAAGEMTLARSARGGDAHGRPGRKKRESAQKEPGKISTRAKGDSDARNDPAGSPARAELQTDFVIESKRAQKCEKPLSVQQTAQGRSFVKAPAQPGKGKLEGPPRVTLAKLGRDDAADLPRGQHWKRRLHPRAW